jgi:predicted nucleic acid-binding Zn finger protein
MTNEEKKLIEKEILKYKSVYDDRDGFKWSGDFVKFFGSLYIHSNATLPALTSIGGFLYIYSNATLPALVNKDFVKKMKELEERHGFIKADGIGIQFTKKRKHNEYTIYSTPFIGNYAFVVTDGTYSAHAKTIKQGIIDIRFKKMERNADDYRDLTPESQLSYDDAIIMYRVITGACSGGTEQFLSAHPELSTRKKYTIKEILEKTQGQYGSETLKTFFKA